MTSEQILPGLPDSPEAQELRFHLRSLQSDLAETSESLTACLPLPDLEPDSMWKLRDAIGDASVTIEHAAQHHVPRMLELAFGELMPSPADPPSEESDQSSSPSEAAAREQLQHELGVVLTGLDGAQKTISELMAMHGDDVSLLRIYGLRLVESLQSVAWPAVLRCLPLVRALHHLADPAAAATEAREQELATPLQEIAIDGARSLEICPRCGAPLTSDDRTFTGSYCENCRTRFYETGQPTVSAAE